MLKLIGVYDYTVILTYLGLLSAVFGMTQASQGNFITAIFCLAFSGLCDTFDGRVARTKKDRTEDEKSFGVQLDSLCDVICFGVFPAMLCYHMGVNGPFGIAVVFFFCLCAVIRLAFFNVLEINHGKEEGEGGKGYRGLPVTSIGIILPEPSAASRSAAPKQSHTAAPRASPVRRYLPAKRRREFSVS